MNWQGTLNPGAVKDRLLRSAVLSYRPLHGTLSPWVKIGYAVFAGAFVPLYWTYQAPVNFLWFFDVALLATAVALWYELRLLASMMALAALLPEVLWNVDCASRLLGGAGFFGLAAPLFDPATSWAARTLSLVHVVFPWLLLWTVHRFGYDARALRAQTLLAWSTLALSYALADTPAAGMAWTFGVGDNLAYTWLPGWFWLALLMLAYPAIVYVPTHLALCVLFGAKRLVVSRRLGPEQPRRT